MTSTTLAGWGILLVHDDIEVRARLHADLLQVGFDTVEAADIGSALRILRARRIQIVLAAAPLLGAGPDVIGAVHRHGPDVHVLALTDGSEPPELRAVVAQADAELRFPLSPADLVRELAGLLRRRVIGGSRAASRRPLLSGEPPSPAEPNDATDAWVVVDGDVVVAASAAAAEILGAPGPEALVGRTNKSLVAPASHAVLAARMARVHAGGSGRPEVLALRRLDGSEVDIEVGSTAVTWKGRPARQVSLWVPEDRSVELRRLVDAIDHDVDHPVFVVGVDDEVQTWNAAAAESSGWTEDEILGRDLADVLAWPGDHAELAAGAAVLRSTGRWHGEVLQRRRTGSSLLVQASATTLRGTGGRRLGTVFVLRDAAAPTSRRREDELVADIRRGLAAHEFVVHYQPIVRLRDRGVVGYEALVRWQHPVRGLLPPAAFIGAAERSGAIVELGDHVLEVACAQARRWVDAGRRVHVAVNLSARQLARPGLSDRISSLLALTSLPQGTLWLEVTETALIDDVEQAAAVLDEIGRAGAWLSIDDFGTGWASLTYLRRLPSHAVKIDRSFVAGLGSHASDDAIVRSVLMLAREMDLMVIGEGVETQAQADRLLELGCGLAQGYLFGRPRAVEELGAG